MYTILFVSGFLVLGYPKDVTEHWLEDLAWPDSSHPELPVVYDCSKKLVILWQDSHW